MMKKCFILAFITVLICSIFAGCSLTKGKDNLKNVKECELDSGDVTKFTYDKKVYRILNENVSDDKIGSIVGSIKKVAILNKNGEIIGQVDIGFKELSKVKEKYEDAAGIVNFLNVYKSADSDSYLIVDADGNYKKAVLADTVKDEKQYFNYKECIKSSEDTGDFTVSSENAAKILSGSITYDVTDEIISKDKLDTYLSCISKDITFDKDTKKPLSTKELSKVDVSGKNESSQNRDEWFYTDVYSIQGVDENSAVAVKINEKFHVARQK